ncbi:MAG TPA: L,D-transpeptidase family protein [Candidatus Acidoferrum sp.]|jgi:murein L,D-transpeptidase YafK
MLKRLYRWIFIIIAAGFVVLAAYALWPPSAAPTVTADRVDVFKAEHKMLLSRRGQPLKTYTVSIGRSPLGPKTRTGDHRTPEGNYVVNWRNPKSKFHLSLHVSYPNAHDEAIAKRDGASPGGDIMIHGLQNGLGALGRLHRLIDWTDGCIAVTNSEMDQIWRAVPDGTPIEIHP